jgi:hypothetical protein
MDYVSGHLHPKPRNGVRSGALLEELWFGAKDDECASNADFEPSSTDHLRFLTSRCLQLFL